MQTRVGGCACRDGVVVAGGRTDRVGDQRGVGGLGGGLEVDDPCGFLERLSLRLDADGCGGGGRGGAERSR